MYFTQHGQTRQPKLSSLSAEVSRFQLLLKALLHGYLVSLAGFLTECNTPSARFLYTGAVHMCSIIQSLITYSCAWMQELMAMMQGLQEGHALPTLW